MNVKRRHINNVQTQAIARLRAKKTRFIIVPPLNSSFYHIVLNLHQLAIQITAVHIKQPQRNMLCHRAMVATN